MAYARMIRLTFATVIVVTLLVAEVIWLYRPVAWSFDRQVTNSAGDSRLVDMAAPQGTSLHLVWQDDRENSTQILYKRSVDNGVSWDPDVTLGDLTTKTLEPLPRLATDDRNLIVVFSNRTDTGEHLFYVRSEDEGTHFTSSTQLTNDLGDQSNPAIVLTGSYVHIVWQNYLQGEAHIIYLRSLDAGLTWEPEIALTTSNALDRHPAIFAYGEKVFVAWSRNIEGVEAVFFRASNDSGASWRPEVQVSSYETTGFLEFPSLASNGTEVNVVWNGAGIVYSRSRDGGATWDPATPITNTTRQYLAPRISASGVLLQVVSPAISTEGNNVTADIYYLASTDGGRQWGQPTLLTSHAARALSLAPAISSRDESTFVAWQDNRYGRFAIFLASKPDFITVSNLEKQLLTSVGIVLAVTTLALILSEVKHRKNHVRQ